MKRSPKAHLIFALLREVLMADFSCEKMVWIMIARFTPILGSYFDVTLVILSFK